MVWICRGGQALRHLLPEWMGWAVTYLFGEIRHQREASPCFSNMSHSCLACCFSPRHQSTNLWPGSVTDAVKKLLGEPLASDATILLRTPASRCALPAPVCTRKQADTNLWDAVLVLERCTGKVPAPTGVRGVSRLGLAPQRAQMLLQPGIIFCTRNLTQYTDGFSLRGRRPEVPCRQRLGNGCTSSCLANGSIQISGCVPNATPSPTLLCTQ